MITIQQFIHSAIYHQSINHNSAILQFHNTSIPQFLIISLLSLMKLLHTADWHLGKKLDQVSRLEEQMEVLNEICEIADREEVDAILIAGDLFDTPNPSIDAIELFYQTLRRLANNGQRVVIGIGGNHDSPDRIEAPDPLARASGILLAGYPHSEITPFALETGLNVSRSAPGFVELQLPHYEYPLRIILTPYANELRIRKFLGESDKEEMLRKLLSQRWQDLVDTYCDDKGVNVLMTHLFVVPSSHEVEVEEDEEEKTVLSLGGAQAVYTDNFPTSHLQYVALGHIHRPWVLQELPFPIVYSSSPLSYSFGDAYPDKSIFLADIIPGQPAAIKQIPLQAGKPTLRTRCEDIPEALEWLKGHPDTWVELTLVTEDHISAKDRKLLYESHSGIIRIIPEFKYPDKMRFSQGKQIDLGKKVEDLFYDFFIHKKGGPPDKEMISLFREIMNEESEE